MANWLSIFGWFHHSRFWNLAKNALFWQRAGTVLLLINKRGPVRSLAFGVLGLFAFGVPEGPDQEECRLEARRRFRARLAVPLGKVLGNGGNPVRS